jgi:hypothetical protein
VSHGLPAPSILTTWGSLLGNLISRRGQFSEAESLFQSALETLEVLTTKNPDLVAYGSNLGELDDARSRRT